MPSRFGIQFGLSSGGVAVPSYTYAVWNPADKSADITLSGAGLIATGTGGGWAAVRATISKLTGDWFYTMNFAGKTNVFIGAGVGGALPDYMGVGGHLSWGLSNGGYVASPGALNSSGIGSGNQFGCRIKRSTSQILMYVDGSLTHTLDASAADGQALFPMFALYQSESAGADFGPAPLGMAVPSGANAGVYDV